MTLSITPAMENTNNSTSQAVIYDPSVTTSETPAITNVKANTNLTLEYRP
jgi:hypothetical protein